MDTPKEHGPGRLIEQAWAPTVTVLYVVFCLATGRPLDYALLAALVVLSVTTIAYVRKLREKRTAPVVARTEPPPIKQPSPAAQPAAPEAEPRQNAQPPAIEQPRTPAEPPNDGQAAARFEVIETQPPKPKAPPAPAERPVVPERPTESRVPEKPVEAQKEQPKRSAATAAEIPEPDQRAAAISAISSLKEDLRAIGRDWPDAAFCQRPLRPHWWTPNSTHAASAAWLSSALDWHSRFKEARAKFFPSAPDDLYLQSLDLEEVFELLDDLLRSREPRPLHRGIPVSAGDAPLVVITAWAAPEEDEDKCGFWIQNRGKLAATKIQLIPPSIAARSLSIYLPPTSVLDKDQKVFVIASLSGPQRTTAYHLEDQFRKLRANPLNGAKPLGIPLRLIYNSKEGKSYASRHEMTLEGGVLKVSHIVTEFLAAPA